MISALAFELRMSMSWQGAPAEAILSFREQSEGGAQSGLVT